MFNSSKRYTTANAVTTTRTPFINLDKHIRQFIVETAEAFYVDDNNNQYLTNAKLQAIAEFTNEAFGTP